MAGEAADVLIRAAAREGGGVGDGGSRTGPAGLEKCKTSSTEQRNRHQVRTPGS